MSALTEINEIDLERYHRIISGMLAHPLPMAIFDQAGHLTWCSHGSDLNITARITTAFRKPTLVNANAFHESYCLSLGTPSGIAGRALPDRTGEVRGWLVLLLGEHDDEELPIDAMSVIDEVAPVLCKEFQQVLELNEMAAELGDRYEELSLLCVVDEPALKKSECRDELSRQIRRCAEQMNVDLAMIWIRQLDALFPAGNNYDVADTASHAWLENVAIACDDWFKAGNGSLGLNSPSDESWKRLGVKPTRKLVAVPLYDGRDIQTGVLLCANSLDRRDFSNSDRKLLEVVADAASKCVARNQDILTGLRNRAGFQEYVKRTLSCSVGRKDSRRLVLCLANLDQFRVINATYGTTAGDELLRNVAQCLSSQAKGAGVIARLDADNFCLLLEDVDIAAAHAESMALIEAVQTLSLSWAGRNISTALRVGLVDITDRADADLDELLHMAEVALYAAKESGGSLVETYSVNNSRMATQRNQLYWVENIKQALADSRFVLYCQRIASLESGDDGHYEILVRMLDEQGELVQPDVFIGTAERYNLMPAVDHWVVEEAVRCLGELNAMSSLPNLSWGINLSGQSVTSASILEHIGRLLRESKLNPENIYFEITETAAVENINLSVNFMREIQAMGCRFALDDFGSGVSSFTYLKNLPVDYLKIDGALIRDISRNAVDQAMVEAIAQVARVMGLKTIAEFVEDSETMDLLRKLNLDYAQGYAIMRPAPLKEEIARLNSGLLRPDLDPHATEVVPR